MSPILLRSVIRLYLSWFLGLLGGLLVVFLVGDFSDRLNAYLDRPMADVALLYWNKLLVAVQQLAPAAMLLGGGATASTLRKRGEWTAMQALGLGRWMVVLPVLLVALPAGILLVGYDEVVVTHAGPRVDRLLVERFGRWGDFQFFYSPHRWFRLGSHLVYIRGEANGPVLTDISVYQVDERFRLVRRYDAEKARHLDGSRWELVSTVERSFSPSGDSQLTRSPSVEVELAGSSAETFAVTLGRPEYMPTFQLLHQVEARARVGLPTERVRYALHNRLTYPATGIGGTLLAVALALRRTRKGHLTQAILEGLLVTVVLFAMLLAAKALVLGDHLAPGVAAWVPVGVLFTIAGAAFWRAERPSARSV